MSQKSIMAFQQETVHERGMLVKEISKRSQILFQLFCDFSVHVSKKCYIQCGGLFTVTVPLYFMG